MIQPPQLTALLAELANLAPEPMALFERGATEPTWCNTPFRKVFEESDKRSKLQLALSDESGRPVKEPPWKVVPLSIAEWCAVFWELSNPVLTEVLASSQPTQIDHTTQIASRGEFEARAEQWMNARLQRPFGLLFIDLDDFKQVNDSQGHLAGDEQLREVGQVLSHSLREGDFVARFGGDEFVALIAGDPSADELEHLADRLRRTVEQHAKIGASIGLALSQDHATLADLLTAADRAMYADKNRRSAGQENCDVDF